MTSEEPRLSARVRAMLTTQHDPQAIKEAFSMIKSMYGDNMPDTKTLSSRLLRDVQRQEYAVTETFCDALTGLDMALADMCQITRNANDEARDSMNCMERAMTEAQALLEHAHALQDQM